MSDTPLIGLPLLEASQAQKHVTHNEALLLLDGLLHLAVISRALAAPPASPGEGDRYLVAASATAAWVGSFRAYRFSRSGELALCHSEGGLAALGSGGILVPAV